MNKRSTLAVITAAAVTMSTLMPFGVGIGEAASPIVVDTAPEFQNGSATGNIVVDDITTLDTTSSEYIETTNAEFTATGHSSWEAETQLNAIQIENEGVSRYNLFSNPQLNHIKQSSGDPMGGEGYYDSANNVVYFSTYGSGVFSYNTNGTMDQSDDTLIANYNSGSTTGVSAQLTGDFINQIYLEGNYLYVIGAGVDVIDTQGTFTDASDDTLIASYSNLSTPALSSVVLYGMERDAVNNLLYVETASGLDIIDDNGTPANQADDVNLGTLGSSQVLSTAIFDDYIAFGEAASGVLVYNRNGAPDNPGGYTLETTYSTVTSPAIGNDYVWGIEKSGDFIYIRTFVGIFVINVGADTLPGGGDDSLQTTYEAGGILPAGVIIPSSYLDTVNNYLFVGTDQGLFTLGFGADTLPGGGDDSIVSSISGSTLPELDNYINGISGAANNWLTITGNDSVALFNPFQSFSEYKPSGTFISTALPLSTTPSEVILWEQELTADHSIEVYTRTGDSSVKYFDHFDDSTAPAITLNDFGAANETGSSLSFLDTEVCFGFCSASFEVDPVADAFSGNAVVTARVRYTSGSGTDTMNFYMNTDQGEATAATTSLTSGAWTTVEFVPGSAFNEIGFSSDTGEGGHIGDILEFDYVQVDFLDATWGPWSSAYAYNTGSLVTSSTVGQSYIQYRVELTTSNSTTTPSVPSVTLADFESVGTYTSEVFDAGSSVNWTDLLSGSTIPLGADIVFSTRTGNTATPDGSWSTWDAVNSPINSPDGQYLQFQADFSTIEPSISPELDSVTLIYSSGSSTDTATISPGSTVNETGGLSVTITPDGGGSSPIEQIRYTADGSAVTPSSTLYSGPIQITQPGTTTIKWIAYNDVMTPVDSGEENYYLPNTTIDPLCHYPETKQCYGSQTFTFSTAESDETILYTLDNTHPVLGNPVYVDPNPITEEYFPAAVSSKEKSAFLQNAKEVSPGTEVTINKNTRVRFASKNRFDQVSSMQYRDSVLNFPHVVTMPDPGANAHVLAFDHNGERVETPNYIIEQFSKNGGSITTGDLNGDGRDEIIMSPGAGKTADLYVFSYHEEVNNPSAQKELILLAFKKSVYDNDNLRTGLNIAAADINNDGKDEIVTVPKDGPTHVLAFQYIIEPDANGGPGKKYLRKTTDANFFAYDSKNFRGGSEITADDLDQDGEAEIITTTTSGQVRMFDKRGNQKFSLGFNPFGLDRTREILLVDTGDVTGDGYPEIITMPKEGKPHILFTDRYGTHQLRKDFFASVNQGQEENAFAVEDMDFDGKPEIVIQDKDTDGKPIVRFFDPETATAKSTKIKPNYPGYTGGLTLAVGRWSGSN